MKVEAARESPPKGERITHSMEEWGKPLQDFMEEKRSPVELMSWLRDLVPELDSPFSNFLLMQRELEANLPAEETPLATEPPQLLPVRTTLVRKFLTGRDTSNVDWVVTLVEVFNYHALLGRPQLGPCVVTSPRADDHPSA